MEEQNNTAQRKHGFLDRKISLRWMLIILGVVVLAGLVFCAMKALDYSALNARLETSKQENLKACAANVAVTIATLANQQIVEEEYEDLQKYVDRLVGSEQTSRILYIAVVNKDGVAVVHTNSAHRGKKFAEADEETGTVRAVVPAMDYTKQVASVHVAMTTE